MPPRNLVSTSIAIKRTGTDSSSRSSINFAGGSLILAGAARPIAAIAPARTVASRSSSIRVKTTMSRFGSIMREELSGIAIEPRAITAADRTSAAGSRVAWTSASIADLTSPPLTPPSAERAGHWPKRSGRLDPDGAIGILQAGNERRDRDAPIIRSMPNEIVDCVHSIGGSRRDLQRARRGRRFAMPLIADRRPDPEQHTAAGDRGDCGRQPGSDSEPGRLPRPQIGAVRGARRCTLAALTHPIGSRARLNSG